MTGRKECRVSCTNSDRKHHTTTAVRIFYAYVFVSSTVLQNETKERRRALLQTVTAIGRHDRLGLDLGLFREA